MTIKWRNDIEKSTAIGTVYITKTKPHWMGGLKKGDKVIIEGIDKKRKGKITSLFPYFRVELIEEV